MRVEIFIEGNWLQCADLNGTPGSRHQAVQLAYAVDYAVEHLFARDHRALSENVPVDLGTRRWMAWPAFLIDLLPQGAARRRLERDAGAPLDEWALLQRGSYNPVGNLRIVPDGVAPAAEHRPFSLDEMLRRGDEFIEYAAQVGATVVGATDTQGEAPKFWIVRDAQGNWYPDDGRTDELAVEHALLKFPVPEAGTHAALILRHEAAYQQIARHLGMRVTQRPARFTEGALLLPRFDRRVVAGTVQRLGVESIYSLVGITDSAQSVIRHDQILIALSKIVSDFDSELREYVQRDLFNLAVGNRDNHVRNTAILKDTDGAMRLAPLFDVGPSFLDARALTRVIRWDGETIGTYDWPAVLDRLEIHFAEGGVEIDVSMIAGCMRDFAARLPDLVPLMREHGVDDLVIEHRAREIERLTQSLTQVQRRG